jgi:mRNA deadenylase 3'-5' endonuclease subunit Ccr4
MIEVTVGVTIGIATYKFVSELFSIFFEGIGDSISRSSEFDDNLDINLDELVFEEDEEMNEDDNENQVNHLHSLMKNNKKIINFQMLRDENEEDDVEIEDFLVNPQELNDLIHFHIKPLEDQGTCCNTMLDLKEETPLIKSEVIDFRNVNLELKERRLNFDTKENSNLLKTSFAIEKPPVGTAYKVLTATNTLENKENQEPEKKLLNKKRRIEFTPTKPKKENIYNSTPISNRKRIKKRKLRKTNPNEISNTPYVEEFIHISKAPNITNIPEDFKISIVTYNILNQIYMKKPNRDDLSLENRMKKIIEELNFLNADIMCLQEADLSTYRQFLLNSFPEYNFIYGVNCGSSFINIIAFKRNKYKFISFKNFSLLDVDVMGNRGVMNVILERSLDKKLISIYNLHLPWRHESQRCDILERVFAHVNETKISKVLLSGDFNSEPYSLPVKLILFDKFMEDLKNPHRQDFSLTRKVSYCQLLTFEQANETHDFQSAYDDYKLFVKRKSALNPNKRINFSNSKNCLKHTHPNITSCTEYFKNTIDYIFHSKSFQLIKILKLPESKIVFEEGFLPSSKFPSDHLKLYAEYKLL